MVYAYALTMRLSMEACVYKNKGFIYKCKKFW